MRCGKTLNWLEMLTTEEIKRFYLNWVEKPIHREWHHSWRKEFRAELPSGGFVSLNRLRSRLNFKVLRNLCIKLLPVHIYQSVLNYGSAERVSSKMKSNKAYPYRSSEFVVDVDSYLAYEPHCARVVNTTNTKIPNTPYPG